MKGVFVILDGVADESCSVLNGKTPLEAAETPNLDRIAKRSKIDYCFTMKEGVAPESSGAVVSLFGKEHRYAPRGALEAQGAGVKLTKGDLALRCNFATVDKLDGDVMDARAGRTLTTKEAKVLAQAINENVEIGFPFEFYSTNQHRGVLVIRGGFSDNISNADPFYHRGGVNKSGGRKVTWSKPLDDDDEAKLAADLVNSFIRKSHEVLDKHPINRSRAKKGLYSANFVLCRDAGNEPIKFKKLKGKWMALGYMPLEKGIARSLGMEVYSFKYPKLKGIDVYSTLYSGLNKAIKNAIKMLKKNRKGIDYFYVHLKETDLPGHDNKPLDKVKMIEIIDKKFFSFLDRYIRKEKLIITADHVTACRKKAHTGGAVPLLIHPHPKGDVKEKRFTEEEGMNGKKWLGKRVLEGTLLKR